MLVGLLVPTWSSPAAAAWTSSAFSLDRAVGLTGRSVAWVSLKAPTRGKAGVYVNGRLVATVDLSTATWQPQRFVWTRTWATVATRTIDIRVLGTAGRPRVDIDGFVVIR
jgi:hypothetical protein